MKAVASPDPMSAVTRTIPLLKVPTTATITGPVAEMVELSVSADAEFINTVICITHPPDQALVHK